MHFGEKIKSLREQKGLLQRQIAAILEIDTPMFSKIERGERNAKREQVIRLAKILEIDKKELLTIWLADRIFDIIKFEESAEEALKVAEQTLKYDKQSNYDEN